MNYQTDSNNNRHYAICRFQFFHFQAIQQQHHTESYLPALLDFSLLMWERSFFSILFSSLLKDFPGFSSNLLTFQFVCSSSAIYKLGPLPPSTSQLPRIPADGSSGSNIGCVVCPLLQHQNVVFPLVQWLHLNLLPFQLVIVTPNSYSPTSQIVVRWDFSVLPDLPPETTTKLSF